jgi:hypothetical protein
MLRWLFLALCFSATAFAASCKSSSPPSSSGDDDAGDDGGACAPCQISSTEIACGAIACVDGVEYQCSVGGEGAIEIQICSDVGDDSGSSDSGFVTLDSGDTGTCNPSCLPGTCGDDGCGGTCMCTGADICNTLSFLCTNGCQNSAGDTCTPGSADLTLCCVDDTMCKTSEAGVSNCCAASGVPGVCQSDGDCCGFPEVHCNTSTAECQ